MIDDLVEQIKAVPETDGWFWVMTSEGPEILEVKYCAGWGEDPQAQQGYKAWYEDHWASVDADFFRKWIGPIPLPESLYD